MFPYNDVVNFAEDLALIPLERFTNEAREALERVQQLLLRLRHNQLDAEHLLLGLLGEPDGLLKAAVQKIEGFQPAQLLEWLRTELGRRPVAAQPGAIFITARARQALQQALADAQQRGDQFAGTEHLLLALLADPRDELTQAAERAGLSQAALARAFDEVRGGRTIDSPTSEGSFQALEKYGVDLTALAVEGQAGPGHRARGGDPAPDGGSGSTHQEQPGPRWRAGRRQDGRRRGPRAAHRVQAGARAARRQARHLASTWVC